jgi:predicted nucleic acid-binding protein
MEPIFIDTGGIDLLMDTRDPRVARYWKRFPKGLKLFISHFAYWEYLRKFAANDHSFERQQFVKALDRGRFEFVPFGVPEAELAVRLYHGVKVLLPDDRKGRRKLTDMQCDIMIAATAIACGKRVLTRDMRDWKLIRIAVERGKLGTLTEIDRKDIIGT